MHYLCRICLLQQHFSLIWQFYIFDFFSSVIIAFMIESSFLVMEAAHATPASHWLLKNNRFGEWSMCKNLLEPIEWIWPIIYYASEFWETKFNLSRIPWSNQFQNVENCDERENHWYRKSFLKTDSIRCHEPAADELYK